MRQKPNMLIHKERLFTFYFFLISTFPCLSQTGSFEAPVAKKIPKIDTIHGQTVIDNYAWLRNKNSADVVNYLFAENAYADNLMSDLKLLRKKLYEEIRGRYNETSSSLWRKRDNYYYYSRFEKDKPYAIHCRKKDSLTAIEEIVLDGNQLARGFPFFSLSAYQTSPDHNFLAFGIDKKGNRIFKVFFKDLKTHEYLKDTISNAIGLIWLNDSKTILYVAPEPKTIRGYRVYKHIVGTNTKDDQLIFEEPDKTYEIGLSKSTSKQYIFLTTGKTLSSETWYMDANKPDKGFKLFHKREARHTYTVNHNIGDEFYIVTNWNAINNRLMKVSGKKKAKKHWEDVVPYRDSTLFLGYQLYRDYLVLHIRENCQTKIKVINRKDKKEYYLDFPEKYYTTGISGNFKYEDNKFRFNYNSMVTPYEVYEYDLITQKRTLLRADTVRGVYNKDDYFVERIYATAKDSALVPITLVYKKDIQLNGNNPLYLESYGSYSAPQDPEFSKLMLSYLERGFVYAIAHIRGGHDLGMQWYEDGKLFNKKNTFTDFIACAEHLIEEKYTNKEKLVIAGASAGGLLMGAVNNMRPDLFKCVIAGVPFVDVMNTMLDETLPLTTFEYDEWGNPHIKAYYDYMRSYSPYDNVEQKKYPAMFVFGGYNDSQVGYWEPSKWVAKLRDMKTDSNTILLRINMNSGHGGASGRYDGWKEVAFQTAFVFNELGIKENYISVSGKVMDTNENPLPFVNVYLKNTTKGTTTNPNGDFSIVLREDEPQELVFKFLGYKTHSEEIIMDTRTNELRIKLESENILLPQLNVTANAKDPGYGIIKNAIDRRKYHLNQVQAYSVDVYMKEWDRLDQIPEKVPFFLPKTDMPDSTDLGLLYLSESVAKFHHKIPKYYKEDMLASKLSGYSQGFSWNRAEDVLFNFYNNLLKFEYYSDRGFISPISNTALFYYRYKLEGTFYDNDQLINKIKVIPRRVTDPVFHGYINIIEDTWNIHSLELFLTKDSQLQYIDTMKLQQSFVPITDSIWMPVSLRIIERLKILGYKATSNYLGFFSNYHIDKEFPRKFFGNEVFVIREGANKKDSTFWTGNRPMILTTEEIKNYRKGDKLEALRETKEYLDSLDKKSNKFDIVGGILDGFYYSNSYKKSYFFTNSVLEMLQFNTIEGLAFDIRPSYTKYNPKTYKSHRFKPSLRYGISNKQFNAKLLYSYYYNPIKKAYVTIQAGKYVDQLNGRDPIKPFINTIHTLLLEENFAKLYDKTFLNILNVQEVVNGIQIKYHLEYSNRSPLKNNTDFTLVNYKNKDYSSNTPNPAANFLTHQALTFGLQLRFRYKQKYAITPKYKQILKSKYPTLTINYKKGIHNLFSSDVDFDYLKLSVSHDIDMKLMGKGNIDISLGGFANKKSVPFIDRKHFNGNRTLILNENSSWNFYDNIRSANNNFQTLDYYNYSTTDNYLEIHYEQHFDGFIINKIPFLRKTKFQTVAGINFFYTKSYKEFFELTLGLDNILKVFRIDIATQYNRNIGIKPEIRIGFDFNKLG